MVKITSVNMRGRNDIRIWLGEDGSGITLLFVAVASSSGTEAELIAEEAKDQEILLLLKAGYKALANFKPEKIQRKISRVNFQIMVYKFTKSPA